MTSRARLANTDVTNECPVCGAAPCRNPSFCAGCRAADARKVRGVRPQYVKDWHDWSGAPPAHPPRPTPRTTIEAIKQAVRTRGVGALDEPTVETRLRACDAPALIEIDRWLSKWSFSR